MCVVDLFACLVGRCGCCCLLVVVAWLVVCYLLLAVLVFVVG